MQEESYPMPSFVTLAVADVQASASWYQSVLGFRLVFSLPGPGGAPMMSHLRFARYADLLLAASRKPAGTPRGAGVQLNFTLAAGALDQFAAHAGSEWHECRGPVLQPWNSREFYVTDPDGYRLAFIEQADAGKSFDEVIAGLG